MIGGATFMSYRLANLRDHGVHRVCTARNWWDPVRFDIGDIGEGLLMPTLGVPMPRPNRPSHPTNEGPPTWES
jgi:hypothetical protein